MANVTHGKEGKGKNLDTLEANHGTRHRSISPQPQVKFSGAKYEIRQKVMALDHFGRWKVAEIMEIREEE